jgi:integrase
VRSFKADLLATKRANGSAVAPKYVQKLLSALRAVLSWVKRQGYVTTNVAEGITQLATKDDPTDRRLPLTVEQARAILEKLPEQGAMRWLWLIGLYSGARLNEIAGLRKEDVREVDGVLCFDITPHDGRGLKNRSSRRTVPVHPALMAAGFTAAVLPFKSDGHDYWKRVNPWLREVGGIIDSRLSFHSTRHTFKSKTVCGRRVFLSPNSGHHRACRNERGGRLWTRLPAYCACRSGVQGDVLTPALSPRLEPLPAAVRVPRRTSCRRPDGGDYVTGDDKARAGELSGRSSRGNHQYFRRGARATHRADLVFVRAWWRTPRRNRQNFAEGPAPPAGGKIQSVCTDGDAAVQVRECRGAYRRRRAGES